MEFTLIKSMRRILYLYGKEDIKITSVMTDLIGSK